MESCIMSQRVTVLMYHAVGNEQGICMGADAGYTVSSGQFAAHLAYCQQAQRPIKSVADLLNQGPSSAVAFTFDDGHASNGPAARLIANQGGSADFFINPAHVGTPHYLGWSELRDMADMGMSIQSHGLNHFYLDDLNAQQVQTQVGDSKRLIEDKLGRAVTIFAPPGGRIAPNLLEVAAQAGYRAVCSSRVGLWRVDKPGLGHWDIPRLAVMLSTSQAQFARWVDQNAWEITNRRARYGLLQCAKQVLGNRRYDHWRARLLGSAQDNA
jgi:peptidoglycan/xylan/chitin deacetylase (PgdA/CDA1 family)